MREQVKPVVYGYVCVKYGKVMMGKPGFLRTKEEMINEAASDRLIYGVKSVFRPSYYTTIEEYNEVHYATI